LTLKRNKCMNMMNDLHRDIESIINDLSQTLSTMFLFLITTLFLNTFMPQNDPIALNLWTAEVVCGITKRNLENWKDGK
jgi:hypothetical protein